jgi:hypothetical protein
MKTVSFAILLAVSAVFLSCNLNANDIGKDGTVRCKAKAKPNYEGLDPICKSEQKKLVYVHDPYDVAANVYSIDSLNRLLAMTPEEADAIKKDFYEKDNLYREYLISIRMPIPCVVDAEGLVRSALLTDEEIAELRKTYDGILIEDPQEYTYTTNEAYTEYESGQGCY